MNLVRALVIVHEPRAYTPSRVSEAARYLLASSSATEEEQRLATEATEWLRSKRDEAQKPVVSSPQPAAERERGKIAPGNRATNKPKRKGRA